jgi:hypothetical protein
MCGTPVADPSGGSDYCCADCAADSALPCTSGATGYECVNGDVPTSWYAILGCASPTSLGNGVAGYCCLNGSTSTCYEDTALTCTTAGSYGYKCASGYDPASLDSSLTCSAGVTDSTGNVDFCCE